MALIYLGKKMIAVAIIYMLCSQQTFRHSLPRAHPETMVDGWIPQKWPVQPWGVRCLAHRFLGAFSFIALFFHLYFGGFWVVVGCVGQKNEALAYLGCLSPRLLFWGKGHHL